MKRALAIGVAIAALTTAAIGQSAQDGRAQAEPETRGPEQARKTIETYCVGCHNSRARVAGLALDTLSLDAVAEHADVWEKAVRKLRGHLMPPPGEPQPPAATIDGFVSWMEGRLDTVAAASPSPGSVGVHRLDRTECT